MRLQRPVTCLVAFFSTALAPAAPPPADSQAPKTTLSQPAAVVPIMVTFRCPHVNVAFQLTPTGADAGGWTGHNESKSDVHVATLTKRSNLGVEYDTMVCVYTLQTDGKVIQDSHVTIVERNAPPQQPICNYNTDIMGFVCRPLKPGEKYADSAK